MVKARVLLLAGLALAAAGEAAPMRGRSVVLPMTCAELLPEAEPFTEFFEAAARGSVTTNARLSKRMFRVLSMRDKLTEVEKRGPADNAINALIRKTLCFYRENTDPVRPIPFDDPQFMKYMTSAIEDLERKADEAVFDAEFARLQREEYEKRLERNQDLIEQLRQEADRAAQRSYEQLSQKARRKIKSP
jgi:hypothetical protein